MKCDLCKKEFEIPEEWKQEHSDQYNYVARKLGSKGFGTSKITARVCEDCAPIMFAKTRACMTKCSFPFWDKFVEGRKNGVF